MQDIIFVTSNKNKLEEFETALRMKLKSMNIDVDEIQTLDVEKVVRDKAIKSYNEIRKPVIVEDTGVYLKNKNGFPGALIKWLVNCLGTEQIALLFKHEPAYFKTAIAYYDGQEMQVFTGELQGHISDQVRGNNGFGLDPVFIPENMKCTLAELPIQEKVRISHRSKALYKFGEYLNNKTTLL